ncbi:unnamed protein product [Parnassius apollo]|uniref:(apollo) hypothetical protein n=1 Tax=Parnassius apollo TaxID=110799 RepID=A0A8S3WSN8_PARAO|nr:unnamed protein product [Parnassius apollo]
MSEQSNTVCALNSGAKKEKRRERKALSERNNKYIDNDPLCLRIQCTCNHGQKSNFKCKQISQQDVVRNHKNFYSTKKKFTKTCIYVVLLVHLNPNVEAKAHHVLLQVFPLPRIPIQKAFYSRQISLYNLCVMDLSEQNNSCLYNWDETESGKGAVSIGSAFYCFLNTQTIPANVKLVRLFCDGCGGQNKNSHVLLKLLFWLQNKSPTHVKKIQVYFPVRGHSFMPADRLFGRVEKDMRKIPVITMRQEYFEIFSKHGRVCELDKDWCLYDIKGLETNCKKFVGYNP